MKILVTGANGYLGQGVVKALLDNGHSVVAADFKTNYVDSSSLMRDFLLYGQRVTKSDSQTVQDCFQLFYHPGQNFLFDFIAVQEQTVNFGI